MPEVHRQGYRSLHKLIGLRIKPHSEEPLLQTDGFTRLAAKLDKDSSLAEEVLTHTNDDGSFEFEGIEGVVRLVTFLGDKVNDQGSWVSNYHSLDWADYQTLGRPNKITVERPTVVRAEGSSYTQ